MVTHGAEEMVRFVKVLAASYVKGDERAYALSLIKERESFIAIMSYLVDSFDFKRDNRRGRPSDTNTLLKAALIKVYLKQPARQLTSELKSLQENGLLEIVPSFNTINKFIGRKYLKSLLENMVTISSMPLNQIETHFCLDASGISSYKYKRWLDFRDQNKSRKDFIKLHLCCGTRTKIVTSAITTEGNRHESPFFIPLLSKTAKYFNVDCVSADAGYCSRKNFNFAKAINAQAYIAFKKGVTGKSKGSLAFKQAFKMAQRYPRLYDDFYHQRSLVEGVFSSIKRRFLDYTRSKELQSRLNEALLKVVCYNVCVLVRYLYSEKEKQKASAIKTVECIENEPQSICI